MQAKRGGSMFCSQEICHFETFLPRESVVGCALVTSWVFCNMPLTCFATDGPHHSDVENFQFEWSTQPLHRFAFSFCLNLTWSWSLQIWSSSRAALWCLKEEKIERCLLQRMVLCERKKRGVLSFSGGAWALLPQEVNEGVWGRSRALYQPPSTPLLTH